MSVIAIALTFYAFLPYIRSVVRGKTTPHVFSWVIWGATTSIVFLAQLEDKGGVGAWPIGVSAGVTLFIALLAYLKRGDATITGMDRVFFACAMSSLPFWYVTAEPLWAVAILTTVDTLGFGPTVRKAYAFPQAESPLFFALFAARNLIVILALEHYSTTTVLFPAVTGAACLLVIAVIAYRRRLGAPA